MALELARRIDGEIVSADSMQLYRGMNHNTEYRCAMMDYLDGWSGPDWQKRMNSRRKLIRTGLVMSLWSFIILVSTETIRKGSPGLKVVTGSNLQSSNV